MRAQLKADLLVLLPETDDEREALASWKSHHADTAFLLKADKGRGATFRKLGPRVEACREPINVYSASPDPAIRLIANFAPTPFTLDGKRYACVEAFWQSLRFPQELQDRIAALDGAAAKRASHDQPYGSHVTYRGRPIPTGTYAHWQLMQRACRAKFEQNENARTALLATGDRPLEHKVRPDSRTIPGVVMADIWMTLRRQLRRRGS
ncbi:MAG: NADAR family protein [Hyphomicrobiales bacterium]|nr:NADAR family protein [Hyphomicrobiales bacterium]